MWVQAYTTLSKAVHNFLFPKDYSDFVNIKSGTSPQAVEKDEGLNSEERSLLGFQIFGLHFQNCPKWQNEGG